MPLTFQKQQQPVYDARVAFIQLVLQSKGENVSPDGLFGGQTENAVKSFQNKQGLAQTGIVDQETGRDHLKLPYWTSKVERTLNTPFRDPNTFPDSSHLFQFRPEVAEGHFSGKPEQFVSGDKSTLRALRTNNPGALNISSWQKKMPGYIGKTQADTAGNETTIYETPEKGVGAWHELVVVLYSHKQGYIQNGTFSLTRLAKAYAGVPFSTSDSHAAVQGYLAGWKKWSERIPDSHLASSEIDPGNVDQLTRLAVAMFSHEASVATPLIPAQVKNGIEQAQLRMDNLAALPAGSPAPVRAPAAERDAAVEEEQANGLRRQQRMMEMLRLEAEGRDLTEALEQ